MKASKTRLDLSTRARDILKLVIREYVRTGKPVGSRRLSRIYSEGVSPATVRNVMADLEEMEFLTQPYTSAGRIPTLKGYRFYVDSLLERKQLSSRDVGRIRSLEQETDPGVLINKTSRLLSALSDNLGFVWVPPISVAVLKHIEFVRLSRNRFLVVLVTGAGLVQHRIIQLDEDLNQTDLNQSGRYLVTHFQGQTLLEIRQELIQLMHEERTLYDRMLKNVILLGSATLIKHPSQQEGSEVYVDGTARLIRKAEPADTIHLASLVRTLEEKERLIRIIDQCVKTNQSGPTVTIGLEQHVPELRDWTIISSPYQMNDEAVGGLGILGPSRMEYDRSVTLVDTVARLFGQLLAAS